MGKYYHATTKENYRKIKESMMLISNYGNYVCKDIESVIEFGKAKVKSAKIKYDEIVIIEFASEDKFEESYNHDLKYHNGAKAYLHKGDVCLKSVKEVNVDVNWEEIFEKELFSKKSNYYG